MFRVEYFLDPAPLVMRVSAEDINKIAA